MVFFLAGGVCFSIFVLWMAEMLWGGGGGGAMVDLVKREGCTGVEGGVEERVAAMG